MQEIITLIIEKIGYPGVFLLIAVENLFPPIPSEVILSFSGFMTTKTGLNIVGVIVSATLGSTAGAVLLYMLGRLFGLARLQKTVRSYGSFLQLSPKNINSAVRFYDKYKKSTVFFCRMIPILRSLISIPAGVAKMNITAFVLLTAAGSLIWNCALITAGAFLGNSWETALVYAKHFSDAVYIAGGIVLALLLIGIIIRLVPVNKILLNKRRYAAHLHSKVSAVNDLAAKIAKEDSSERFDDFLREYLLYAQGIRRKGLVCGFRSLERRLGKDHALDRLYDYLKAYLLFIKSFRKYYIACKYLPEPYCKVLCTAAILNGNSEYVKKLCSMYYKGWLSGTIDLPKEYFDPLLASIKSADRERFDSLCSDFISSYIKKDMLNKSLKSISSKDYGKALLLYSFLSTAADGKYIKDDYKIKIKFIKGADKDINNAALTYKSKTLLSACGGQTERIVRQNIISELIS